MWNEDKVLWHREWYGLRWVDLSSIHDVLHVKRHLHILQQFPEAKSLTINTIADMLSRLHDKSSIPSSIGREVWHASPADEEALSSPSDSACTLLSGSFSTRRVSENGIEVDYTAAAQMTIQTTGMTHTTPCRLDVDFVPKMVLDNDLNEINSVYMDGSMLDVRMDSETTYDDEPEMMLCSGTVPAPFALALSPCDTPSLLSSWEVQVRAEASRLLSDSAVRRECQEAAPQARDQDNSGFLLKETNKETTTTNRCDANISPIKTETNPPVATEQDGHIHDIPLLHLAAQHGWDRLELRRCLYTLGYSAEPVWRLLASLPPSLRSVILDAADADCAADAAGPSRGGLGALRGAGVGCGGWDEARGMFSAAEERMRQAMEEDGEVGFLEVAFDPASQRRTHVFLNDRYAAIRGASRQALLSRFADHAVELPSTEPDLLAALLHALLRRRDADCTQYLRVAGAGGRPALVCEHSRKRYDASGRVVKVRRSRAPSRPSILPAAHELIVGPARRHTPPHPALPPFPRRRCCRRLTPRPSPPPGDDGRARDRPRRVRRRPPLRASGLPAARGRARRPVRR
jgi:hypothetical protein